MYFLIWTTLYGTLIKTHDLRSKLFLKKNNIDVNLDAFLSYYEPINLEYWKLYREEKIDKESLRFGRLNDTFKKMNVNIEDEIIYKLSEDYIANLTTYNHLFDGTVEILDYLKPKYKLHIITNGFEEVQDYKLKKSNIFHYFDTITNSEMVGVKKPNPKIFNHALNLAKTTKEQSVMIGDNYEADVLGALNIGLNAICFNYHNETLPDYIIKINKLIELKKLL